jgi:hypothetical protein
MEKVGPISYIITNKPLMLHYENRMNQSHLADEGSLRRSVFCFVLALLLTLGYIEPAQCEEQATTSTIDLITVRSIIGGGTTPEATALPGVAGLQQIKTRRLRLINVDKNLKGISSDGKLVLEWSQKLNQELRLCKENGWIPRIVIGQVLPPSLKSERMTDGSYGPSSWLIYDAYVTAFLVFVIDKWGFRESEWEIGNEMNIPSENWVAHKLPAGPFDMEGFRAYMTLYSHIAKTVEVFKLGHPESIIRVGGPAVSPPGFLQKDEARNWALRFVDEVAMRRLPCDFVSVHVYGNEPTGSETFHALTALKRRMLQRQVDVPISVSEWGASWASDRPINFGPIAGAFVFEFARVMDQARIADTIFLALSEFRVQKVPVLYALDGTPTHAMKAMLLLTSLDGVVLPCETGLPTVSCLAVRKATNNVNVIVWYLDWWHDQIGPRVALKSDTRVQVSVAGLQSIQYGGSVARISTHSSRVNCPCPLGATVAINPSTIQLAGVELSYGDYALLTLSPAN